MPTGMKFRPTATDNISLNATVADGPGVAIALQDCRQGGWFFEYDPDNAPTTGTINVEHSYDQDYLGAWSILAVITAANVVAGTENPDGTYPGPLGFLRGNIPNGSEPDEAITLKINGLLG